MKKKIKQTCIPILVLFWIVSFQNIIGQSSFVFHHLETNEGLSNNNVRAFLRDSYGFLWVGTESGLNRYDGYEFKVFQGHLLPDNTLTTDNILGLQEDGSGNIWIDLGESYIMYKRDKDIFLSGIKEMLITLGIKAEDKVKIYIDNHKNLWAFNKKEVFFYHFKEKTTKTFKLKIPVDKNTCITDKGEYLYGIQYSGICWKLNKRTGVLTFIPLPDSVKQEFAEANGTIYIDSQNGLWLYSDRAEQVSYKKNATAEWKKFRLLSGLKTVNNHITSICENQSGQIWLGTDHKGLFIYNKTRDLFENLVYSPWADTGLTSNSVSCLYKDNKETIWVGYNKKGLSFYHESFLNFLNFRDPECSDIISITEDDQGDIWLGTDGNGLYIKEQKTKTIKKLAVPSLTIIAMLQDKKKRIWIGTFQNGLLCYENGKISQYTTKNSKISSNNIWSLKEDRNGNLWIGALGGKIQVLDSDAANFASVKTPFDDIIYVEDMFYDGGDKMYIATVYGIRIVDVVNYKMTFFKGNKKGNQSFVQDRVSNIYKDKRGLIWLGSNDGLTIWDQTKDKLYYFKKENGLCDNSIKGIIEDNLNNIWVTTSNGFSILTAAAATNGEFTFSSKNYSVKDGLMDNYFNGHAIYKSQNGDILLGNAVGYTTLNPNKMSEKDQSTAKVIFTGLTVGNTAIQVDSFYDDRKLLNQTMQKTTQLNFRHDDKLISLQFTTGDLLNADKVKYVYQIEGFDTHWIPTEKIK